uniref:BRMS1 like transcriptional repressor b n=1 Tax=Sinocyclocheilus grahami TaxID=75366 RepID=A0A672KCI6_SINGR
MYIISGIYRELCLESVRNKYDCEMQAASQHWESEKLLLFDTVQSELEEKIRRLEEDRHSVDITSELWSDGLQSRKNKKKDPLSPGKKKKKPVVVSDILYIVATVPRPYIVYMLQDLDILEDWTAIRKVILLQLFIYLDFLYHSYRGQAICINRKDEYPTRCVCVCVYTNNYKVILMNCTWYFIFFLSCLLLTSFLILI